MDANYEFSDILILPILFFFTAGYLISVRGERLDGET